MIRTLKNLFKTNKEEEYVSSPPGRTFNRVLTGRYFGCENKNADAITIAEAKKEKIEQIKELELKPKFVRFSYDPARTDKHAPVSAYVAFQKEVYAENWHMVHVTELAFTVFRDDFEEFEEMAGVSLTQDFQDLSSVNYDGEERRREKRD
ncbi:MAG TPA: hypothetical protein VIM88_06935 [Sulfurovum sp.]|uniref:hypothetical protein n=1 Tax=Sulfurovum sp. TaxID=1969726 RepID=UPI002F938C7E